MAISVVAKTYAQVLRDMGKDKNLLDSFAEELSAFNGLVASEEDLGIFMNLPSIDRETKKRFIVKILSENMSGGFIDFICVLIDNGRQDELRDIETAYRELLDEERKSLKVELVTASPIDSGVRSTTVEMLSKKFGKNVILDEKVDPAIVGGMVIRAGDTVIDGSLRSRLKRVKEKLLLSTIKGEEVYENTN